MKIVFTSILMLLGMAANAQHLLPPPIPGWFTASSYPYLWISGIAPDGNIAGVVVGYHSCAGRGCHITYNAQLVEWDWQGNALLIGPCPDPTQPYTTCPPRAPHGPYELVNNTAFWPQVEGPGTQEAGFDGNQSWIVTD
jgi:hypothetical protein